MYTGLEPVISAVTGRHPNQLNEYTYLRLKRTPSTNSLIVFLYLPRKRLLYTIEDKASVYTLYLCVYYHPFKHTKIANYRLG